MQMLVKAKGLRKSYRNRTVVDGIDLARSGGEKPWPSSGRTARENRRRWT